MEKDQANTYRYLFNTPTSLSPYLQMFLPPNVEYDDEEDSEIVRYKGINKINPPHSFLAAEGTFKC